jgi:hypothetical protein
VIRGRFAALGCVLLAASLGACSSLVGIHPYRQDAALTDGAGRDALDGKGPGDAPRPADAGPSAAPGGGGGAAGADGGDLLEEDAAGATTQTDTDSAAASSGTDSDASGDGQGGGLAALLDATGSDGAPCPSAATMTGTAFQFSAGPRNAKSGMGSCGFPNAQLSTTGHFYGAVDPTLLASAARCGVCMRVAFGGQSVEVTIIDVIANNTSAHGSTLALDGQAIQTLSPSAQNLDVTFSFVPCADPGNIRVRFTSATDASVLILGHRNQLQAIRLSSASLAAVDLTRAPYNVWQPPSGVLVRGGPVTLELTDVYGNIVAIPNLAVSADVVDTGQQFPVPPC